MRRRSRTTSVSSSSRTRTSSSFHIRTSSTSSAFLRATGWVSESLISWPTPCASALLEALSTGHEGSLTTIHAGSAAGAIDRLALLLARAGELGAAAIARHVAQGIDILVHVCRDRAGTRAIREIAAIEDGSVTTVWRSGEAAVRMPAHLRRRLG
ncbi:MAG: hypothetical protein E6J13_03630 [Chloroflexi bacterium]|nr:MAG: hypothetical protein E6J13_03630 [Chloroflexota bacterium]